MLTHLNPGDVPHKSKEELEFEHQKLVEYLAAVKWELHKHAVKKQPSHG